MFHKEGLMPSFLWGSQKGPFSGAFLKGFDYKGFGFAYLLSVYS
jgi:hypothetical protein